MGMQQINKSRNAVEILGNRKKVPLFRLHHPSLPQMGIANDELIKKNFYICFSKQEKAGFLPPA
jgi:hypothetical protein